MKGKIKKIEEVTNLKLNNIGQLNGTNGSRLGMAQMINALGGYGEYDGYLIETDTTKFLILIENGQSCCEDWGYFSCDDNFEEYIGKEIREIVLTDTELKNKTLEEKLNYVDKNQVQFVTFKFTDGEELQFTVYNSHNGYYGHSILVAENEEILLSDTL